MVKNAGFVLAILWVVMTNPLFAQGSVPTTDTEIREALEYENYDRDRVVAIVNASVMPDYQKEGILSGLERFEDNPDALKSILEQLRTALGLQ